MSTADLYRKIMARLERESSIVRADIDAIFADHIEAQPVATVPYDPPVATVPYDPPVASGNAPTPVGGPK